MKTKSIILIVIAGLFWGTSGIFVHFLSPLGYTSVQMIAMRGTVASLCFLLYALIFNRSLFKISLKEALFSFLSGASMFLCGLTYYMSMRASSVSTAVVLMYTSPVMVMAFSVIFFKEKLTLLKGISVGVMLIGCALVSGIIGGAKFNTEGVILGLLAGVMFSVYNIFVKIEMRKGFNPVSSSMYCFFTVGILALLFSSPLKMLEITADNLEALPLIIGIGICTSALPYFLYTLSLRDMPAGLASSLSIMEPMSATFYSILFLNEKLTVQSFMGIVLVIGAVLLISKTE